MNVLVTGANGFIGKWVAEHLAGRFDVTGVGTKDRATADISGYVRWDMGHDDIPDVLLKNRWEAIVHIASHISVDDLDPELLYVNVVGTQKLMKICKETDCRIFILFSSLPIIGIPGREAVREQNFVDPPTMYHATKAMQEYMVKQLEKDGVRVVSIRIPSPIAPDMKKPTIFSIFCNRVLNGEDIVLNGRGTRRQNYIDVRDIAKATERFIVSPNAVGVYNIGSEKSVSNYELAEKCMEIAGNGKTRITFSGKDDPADSQTWDVDLSRIKIDIGYKPEYPIERTIQDFMRQNKDINGK
ncbi:MAG: NAD(P)-dependent oxidoreductase [Lachnospiraceae bacterium]|nr:NAD(P)-dependent oxidoreductase [Lachnospiraceae bacterium]